MAVAAGLGKTRRVVFSSPGGVSWPVLRIPGFGDSCQGWGELKFQCWDPKRALLLIGRNGAILKVSRCNDKVLSLQRGLVAIYGSLYRPVCKLLPS